MTPLSDKAKALLDAPTFAAFGTVNPNGAPQLSTMWVTRDGDDVLISTLVGRQKEKNIRKDSRVSVLLTNPDNPEAYVEIRGTAQVTEAGGRDLIESLSLKYRGTPFPVEGPDRVRVVVRIAPTKLIEHN
jgi:PPOX class probable F420-dependent enzyme